MNKSLKKYIDKKIEKKAGMLSENKFSENDKHFMRGSKYANWKEIFYLDELLTKIKV